MILPVAQPATRPTMIHQSIVIACLLQRREFCALKCGHVKSSAESCRGKMRSSSLGKVESSALMRHGGTQRGAVDVGTRPGSAESLACREPATYHPSASRPRAGGEQPMGTSPAATDETGGRWWGGAPVTGTTLEPQTAPRSEEH